MVCYPIPRGGVAGAVEWAWALLVNTNLLWGGVFLTLLMVLWMAW